MKTTFLSLVCIIFLSGCASPKTGCPSNQVWYQPGKNTEQTKRDLAACQNEALVYGHSYSPIPADSAGRAIALGMIDAGFESHRENKIVRTCMIAKGYKIVGTNSPLLSNNQVISSPNPPLKRQVELKESLEDFYYADKEARYWQQQLANINAGKDWIPITGWDENGNPVVASTRPPSIADREQVQTMINNCLKAKDQIQEKIRLLTTSLNKSSDADKKAEAALIGHWVCLVPDRDSGKTKRCEYFFLPQNRYKISVEEDGSVTNQTDEGRYYTEGNKLVTWSDTEGKLATLNFVVNETQLTMWYDEIPYQLMFQKIEGISDADKKAVNDLVGHWENVAFKGKQIDDPAEKLELDFLPDNHLVNLVATTITKGKTYTIKSQYTVRGDKLMIISPELRPESVGYSLIGDHLVIIYSAGEVEVIFQRVRENAP